MKIVALWYQASVILFWTALLWAPPLSAVAVAFAYAFDAADVGVQVSGPRAIVGTFALALAVAVVRIAWHGPPLNAAVEKDRWSKSRSIEMSLVHWPPAR